MTNPTDNAVRPRRVTAQMVADLAGVSRSAVSRAFTEGGYVDAEKRNRIFAVAAEVGYQPNALAAGLQGGWSHLVAVVVGAIRNPHDNEFFMRLCDALNQQGLWPLLITGEKEGGRPTVEDALRFPLDAIAVRGSMSDALVQRCRKLGIPMIFYGRSLKNAEADTVCCQNTAGMQMIVEALLARDRRRFAFIAGPAGFHSSDDRRTGLVDVLDAAALELAAEVNGHFTVEGGFEAAKQLIQTDGTIDAIVCANDASAIGALGHIQALGMSVPDDILVTGFDDTELAGWPMFSLTTVRNPIGSTIDAIVTLMQKRFADSNKTNEKIHILPRCNCVKRTRRRKLSSFAKNQDDSRAEGNGRGNLNDGLKIIGLRRCHSKALPSPPRTASVEWSELRPEAELDQWPEVSSRSKLGAY